MDHLHLRKNETDSYEHSMLVPFMLVLCVSVGALCSFCCMHASLLSRLWTVELAVDELKKAEYDVESASSSSSSAASATQVKRFASPKLGGITVHPPLHSMSDSALHDVYLRSVPTLRQRRKAQSYQ